MSTIKRIVVNKHKIKSNIKNNACEPVLSVQHSTKSPDYGHEVDIIADGKIVGTFYYTPQKPLACGATVYFTTKCEVKTRIKECSKDGK